MNAIRTLALAVALATPTAVSAASGPADFPAVAPVATCASLRDVDLSAIGGAGSAVTATEETTSDGIAVCSVMGRLAPAITFQLLLPTKTWTQRYLQVGCGGLCGSITLQSGASAGCRVLAGGGFAMAATDMGHTRSDVDWGLDRERRTDFAYRAQHLTAGAAKALIAAYYGRPEQRSYFNGCSDGGREALMEAMRYPDDFDGIIAGAPAMLFQVQNTLYHGWQATSNYDAAGRVILTSDKLPLVHEAVVAACDGLDGLADGLIAQPAQCVFDPQTLVGKGLTQSEADVVAAFYRGPQDPATKAWLTAGQPLPGSELEWQGVYVADRAEDMLTSERIVEPALRTLAFDPPRTDATLSDLAFTEETLAALRPRHSLLDATQSDLSAFERAGGKLILWHGLADPHIAPANTVAFFDAMQARMGADVAASFSRLYLLPGVAHCGGGRGPAGIDLLSAMLAWVEGDVAPDAILTSSSARSPVFGQFDVGGSGQHQGMPPKMDLGVAPLPAMTRPVYPYPHTARFTGSGDWTDAAGWTRGEAAPVVATRVWPGSDLFGAYDFSE